MRNILLDPLLKRAEPGRGRVQALADDILVLARVDSIEDLNGQVNEAFELIA